MNYERIYNQIIERAKNEETLCIRKKNNGNYYERHHIIPKCLDGTNDKENLVLLTAREHFLCHWILARIYTNNNKITSAFWAMCNQRKKSVIRYIPNSRIYQEAREMHSKNISKIKKGRKMSDDTKKKLSEANKGQIPWNKGLKYEGSKLDSVRSHLSNPKRCAKISNSMKGKKKSAEHVKKLIGKKRSICICPHCNKSGGVNNMYRYHFDNCKYVLNDMISFKKMIYLL